MVDYLGSSILSHRFLVSSQDCVVIGTDDPNYDGVSWHRNMEHLLSSATSVSCAYDVVSISPSETIRSFASVMIFRDGEEASCFLMHCADYMRDHPRSHRHVVAMRIQNKRSFAGHNVRLLPYERVYLEGINSVGCESRWAFYSADCSPGIIWKMNLDVPAQIAVQSLINCAPSEGPSRQIDLSILWR